MLSADLLEKQGEREEAIAYVLRADSIVSLTDNYEWKARISGFLSTQYRIIGLIDQGKRYLKKGLEASNKITPKSASDQYKGMVYQEMAHYAMQRKDYEEAIILLKKVGPLFSSMKNVQMKNFFFGNNEEMLGRSYLGLVDYKTAQQHYNKALDFLNKAGAGASQWAGMTFHGLGKIALEKKAYAKSLSYLQKADTIAIAIDHTSLKELVYRDLSDYYKTMGDLGKYSFYNTKYLRNVNKNIKSERAATNGAINRLYEKQQGDLSLPNKLIMAASVLFLLGVLLYYFIIKKRKREQWLYEPPLTQPNVPEGDVSAPEISHLAEDGNEERFMPEETEMSLLQKLEKFEKNQEFLNPNLSLTLLAANLRINTKYLSHVINNHKKKDFNNYVNELRVFYIIQKIQTDPSYLNYKISYLANECGFSSHSKFATVFKNTTGFTPSTFLDRVRSEIAASKNVSQ